MNITELSDYIKKKINGNDIEIIGEISQPKISNGHLYFSLKDHQSIVKCIMWRVGNQNEFKEGSILKCICRLNYYSPQGNLSIIVQKVLSITNEGELKKKMLELGHIFMKKGYFDKKIIIPNFIHKILILTSKNGAALQDFIHNLHIHHCSIKYDICDVRVQGAECVNDICNILNRFENKENYDLVIIMRGGGSYDELNVFNDENLIETVYHFSVPILSAIGHQCDSFLLDKVADYFQGTPSLAAQFIIDWNQNKLQILKDSHINMKNIIKENIYQQLNKFNQYSSQLYKYLLDIRIHFKNKIIQSIHNHLEQLNQYEKLLFQQSAKKIQFLYQNQEIDNPLDLIKITDVIDLIWNHYQIKIKIM
jgi:exodeoxyribonuclease VII large subunit